VNKLKSISWVLCQKKIYDQTYVDSLLAKKDEMVIELTNYNIELLEENKRLKEKLGEKNE
jgi:hypothetical protein